MLNTPFFDPQKSYKDNFEKGPFGPFADKTKYKNRGKPTDIFLGQPVYIPFGIAAGPLLNGEFVKAALDKGFDIVTYKTVRTGKYPCHPWPNVLSVKIEGDLTIKKSQNDNLVADTTYKEPLSITNSFGVPSFDPDFWQEDLKSTVKYAKKGQVVIGSFQGTTKGTGNIQDYIDDFALAARLVKETGTKILEANLSCPNEGSGHLLCFDLERTGKIVNAIKAEIGETALVLKLAYFEDQKQLEKLVKMVGDKVQGLSVVNTIAAKIVDKNGNQALPGKGRLMSGVCGRPIKWAGLDMAKRLKSLREKLGLSYTIIGVGGVTTPEDYKEYRNAGADAVMSATGAIWNPYLAQEIKEKQYEK